MFQTSISFFASAKHFTAPTTFTFSKNSFAHPRSTSASFSSTSSPTWSPLKSKFTLLPLPRAFIPPFSFGSSFRSSSRTFTSSLLRPAAFFQPHTKFSLFTRAISDSSGNNPGEVTASSASPAASSSAATVSSDLLQPITATISNPEYSGGHKGGVLHQAVKDSWLPWDMLANYMGELHDAGFPWVVCFGWAVLFTRVILIPINIKQQRIGDETRTVTSKLRAQILAAKSDTERADFQKQISGVAMNSLKKSIITSLYSAPFFATLFVSVRTVIKYEPEMTTAGVLWFGDLTQIPCTEMACVTVLFFAFSSFLSWRWMKTPFNPILVPLGLIFAGIFVVATRTMTVGYQMILQMSTFTTILINYGLSHDSIRKRFGLVPYSQIALDVIQQPSSIVIPQLREPIVLKEKSTVGSTVGSTGTTAVPSVSEYSRKNKNKNKQRRK